MPTAFANTRREVHYGSLAEFLADAERLAKTEYGRALAALLDGKP